MTCARSSASDGTAVPPAPRRGGGAAELKQRFGRWHDPIPGLIGAISTDRVLRDDVYWIAESLPAYHRGRVAILGYAAHAMTPHLGQGACQAIEDAFVLASVVGPEPPQPQPPQPKPPPAATAADLAAYTTARLSGTRMAADGSYRATRLSGMTSPVCVAVRNTGIRLAGRLAPGLMLRQMDPIVPWTPLLDSARISGGRNTRHRGYFGPR